MVHILMYSVFGLIVDSRLTHPSRAPHELCNFSLAMWWLVRGALALKAIFWLRKLTHEPPHELCSTTWVVWHYMGRVVSRMGVGPKIF